MDPDLAHTVRYDELRLAECAERPVLHRHQIAAYEAHREVARASRDAIDLLTRLATGGRVHDMAAAAWCDRTRNLAAVLRGLGDDELAGIAEAAVARVAATRGEEGRAMLAREALALETRRTSAAIAGATLGALACGAIDWVTAGSPGARAEAATALAGFWRLAREHDPRFSWQRATAHPPYRRRLPFDDDGVALLGRWLRSALGVEVDTAVDLVDLPPLAAPVPAPEVPEESAPVRVGTAAEAAAVYRDQLAATDPRDPALAPLRATYARIVALGDGCASAPALYAAMAEERLFTRVARHALDGHAVLAAARADERGHLHSAQHQRALADALAMAVSPTEIEHVVDAATLCFAVEVTWHDVLLHAITRPVQAAAVFEREDTPATRAAVRASVEALGALLGTTLAAALATPRLEVLLERLYLPLGQQVMLPDGALIATYGDSGLIALPELRAAASHAIGEEVLATAPPEELDERLAAAYARPRFASARALRDHLLALAARAHPASPPDRAQAPVVVWDAPVALDELHAVDVPALRPRPAW